MADVVIAERFRGPPDSGNGGYTCGLLAQFVEGPAEVTLRSPPPLGRPLSVRSEADRVSLLDGEILVAEGTPAAPEVDVPPPVDLDDARRATQRFPLMHDHPYPTCFVCGTLRDAGDGLRVFAGRVDDGGVYAAPWKPTEDLAGADGLVRPEFVWSVLDCPSSSPIEQFGEVGLILLGRLTASLRGPVRAGEDHVAIAWPIARDGRKLNTGSALFSADGELRAAAQAVWIELAPR